MANLIVEAVPARQTGVASGMNTVMRTLGGAVGAQIAATLIADHVRHGIPLVGGFTLAFAFCAGSLVVSVIATLAIPGRTPAQELADSRWELGLRAAADAAVLATS